MAMVKRKILKNVYGNWVGYRGRERVEEFGDHASSEADALVWFNTGIRPESTWSGSC